MKQIFSASLREGWGDWEIRVLVIVSLVLQTILILLGSRRKHLTTNWLNFLVWVAYLSTDWVATVALSLLSIKHLQYRGGDDCTKNPEYILTAFWAPFLLLHLGGPDTITAYSLEDNELFWRHFLMLLVQAGVAVHVLLRAWTGDFFTYLSLPMFVCGIIKFGERSWVLRCAKGDFFRTSMFPSPDPGPNYARFMEVYRARKAEGYLVQLGKINDDPTVGDHSYPVRRNFISDAARLQDAFVFFKMVKRLFADLILSVHDVVNSRSLFNSRKCEMVFEVIEIELGFMFDVLYTKAVLIHSRIGCVLRVITISCTVSVFLALSLRGEREQEYSRVDIIITYALLVGAMCLEVYSIMLLLSSDWTRLWLSNHKNTPVVLFYSAVSMINSLLRIRRWSNLMAQYNLIKVCRKESPARYRCFKFLMSVPIFSPLLEKYLYRSYVAVPKEVKELVLNQLKQTFKDPTSSSTSSEPKHFCSQRGTGVLKKYGEVCLEKLRWSVEDAEFEESILLWHIATDLCYHTNSNDNPNIKNICKLLSDYMMYLLVMRPSMLPNGIGEIRFQDTCAELAEFCKEKESVSRERDVLGELLEVSTEIPPSDVKGDRSKSVLFNACRLAKDLRGASGDDEVDWKLVSEVWLEMLCFAASQCRRTQHAQHLRQGGELLTHVWLLMAHLGITEQFQISNGHTRARLIIQ